MVYNGNIENQKRPYEKEFKQSKPKGRYFEILHNGTLKKGICSTLKKPQLKNHKTKKIMFIITATSAINSFAHGAIILGVGHTKGEALLNAYGRTKLQKGHFIQEIDPDSPEWADCEKLDQYR